MGNRREDVAEVDLKTKLKLCVGLVSEAGSNFWQVFYVLITLPRFIESSHYLLALHPSSSPPNQPPASPDSPILSQSS